MALIPAEQTIFIQGGDKAGRIAVPAGQSATVRSDGATLYYKSTSDVTSASSDGTIATGASTSFTAPKYVICAQGASTQVLVTTNDTASGSLRVGDDLVVVDSSSVGGVSTATGASTATGGVAGGIPRNISTWQPVAATSGTDTACTNGTAYVGSVYVPMNCTVTGIQYLIGSVGGTDKAIVSLHSASGAVLANSDVAGTTVGTAANNQQIAFTSTYAAVGPAYYFVAVTFNGTTAKFRSVPAHTAVGVIGNGVSQTFGTVAAFTAPTTFTADKVPIAALY